MLKCVTSGLYPVLMPYANGYNDVVINILKFRTVNWWLISLLCVALWGCASVPIHSAPIQEMSDARQAIAAAIKAGATEYSPISFAEAQRLLLEAQGALAGGDYAASREDAIAAQTQALKALEEALLWQTK